MGRPKKKPTDPLPSFHYFTMQASPEWIAWTKKAARHYRLDVSKLIDVALCEYTRARGFAEEPPTRTRR